MTKTASKSSFFRKAILVAAMLGVAASAVPAQAGGLNFHFDFGKGYYDGYGYGYGYDDYCMGKRETFKFIRHKGFKPLAIVAVKGDRALVRARDDYYHYILTIDLCDRKLIKKEEDILR